MTKIMTWAAGPAIAVLAWACTTEVTTDNGDGGTGTSSTATSTGSGGSGGSTGTGTGGSTGTGGGGDNDAGTCAPSATATACETCAFAQCMSDTCDCKANAACGGAVGDFFKCLSTSTDPDPISMCSADFQQKANADGKGGEPANAVATCMDVCVDVCQGKDAGPRPRRQR